eukprot:TRINITY_DN2428_c0_g1_i1.p2 TRINITY_DN2428_c0_g1~~TRINITY_DN2428_c0_g1_i1.p2  ORF type:complete len:254 (-),score=23.13 TRINITY_DN2428_c0_g1_i1:12-773(-)
MPFSRTVPPRFCNRRPVTWRHWDAGTALIWWRSSDSWAATVGMMDFSVQLDWISEAQESLLLHQINAVPASQWRQVTGRRLQNLGGTVLEKGMIPTPLPTFLAPVLAKLEAEGVFPHDAQPNHVLINEYAPGQGIMAHEDGPLYHPLVAILSLGSQCVMKFTPKRSAQEAAAVPLESFSVFLPRRSLLLFERTLYTQYLHEIENLAEDQIDSKVLGAPPELAGVALPRGLRVSLTIRNVKKVLRAAIHLGNRR